MVQKPVQFFFVSSLPNGELNVEKLTERLIEKPEVDEETFPQLDGRAVHGRFRVENEFFVAIFITGDEAAHERFVRESKDRIARAQELMVPPANPYSLALVHIDDILHLADEIALNVTLCGQEVREIVSGSLAERCEECFKRAGPAGLVLDRPEDGRAS